MKVSEELPKERDVRICWEWNGCGNQKLVEKAAELSFKSGGIVKFDLNALDPNLSIALSGVPNYRAYKNFEMIVDIDTDTPYSLLVFHPAFYMSDMPITPRKQVEECYKTSKRYLDKVNIGNKHLLG